MKFIQDEIFREARMRFGDLREILSPEPYFGESRFWWYLEPVSMLYNRKFVLFILFHAWFLVKYSNPALGHKIGFSSKTMKAICLNSRNSIFQSFRPLWTNWQKFLSKADFLPFYRISSIRSANSGPNLVFQFQNSFTLTQPYWWFL